MNRNDCYYLGIDMNDHMAMISYYTSDMTEPDTVLTPEGAEFYQFPLLLARKRGRNDWLFGQDAERMVKEGDAVPVANLLSRALEREEILVGDTVYPMSSLLGVYLEKLIRLTGFFESKAANKRIILVLDNVSAAANEMFSAIIEGLGHSAEAFLLIDRKSAFCSFALKQKESLWAHDVVLFEYRGSSIRSYDLTRYTRVRPQVVDIKESRRYALSDQRDLEFTQLIKNTLDRRHISSVYLVGDGFDGGWMKISLNYLCRGRRVFLGSNLYSKGACYAAWISDNPGKWPFIYLGENEMKFSMSLPVRGKDRMESLTLISAGTHFEQARTTLQVIVDGSMELDVLKKLPMEREAMTETLVMEGFPIRKNRMTRLEISAIAVSDSAVELGIRDLGFGDYYKSSGKTWHFTITV